MVRVATYFAMTFGAFLFWQSMDRLHVWIALHQDEKVLLPPPPAPPHPHPPSLSLFSLCPISLFLCSGPRFLLSHFGLIALVLVLSCTRFAAE
ncbi:uncharacterized protein LOC109726209 [Ananas comosus]|uniref:Uncharacterized protein LOC109726209 n=1 Tax=Ananas comosus TaxID=4615 RepID=A0A6P5GTW4_ANACO|nr:uncharacterized protein LOC109726209 [Ananas comosus]